MLSPVRPVLLAVVTLLLIACGGGDKKDGGARDFENPDQGRASQVAHAALLETKDLVEGWTNYSTDSFASDDSNLPDTGNCAAARNLALDMSKWNVARAQRSLQHEVAGHTTKAQIEMHVRIFDKAQTANDYLKRNREAMTGDGYIRCLQDGFAKFFGPNARVRFGDARARAPRDGVTAAFDQDIQSDQTILRLHTDYFAWVQNNAYILVLMSGPREADSADITKEVLEKVQARVDEAFKIPKQ
jgi:hypothetical protein